jgi:hypothetical protein
LQLIAIERASSILLGSAILELMPWLPFLPPADRYDVYDKDGTYSLIANRL